MLNACFMVRKKSEHTLEKISWFTQMGYYKVHANAIILIEMRGVKEMMHHFVYSTAIHMLQVKIGSIRSET
jgi:hypothetical protein